MVNIAFKNYVNFWHVASTARSKNIDDFLLLNEAFNQNVLNDQNTILLKNFIKCFKNKKGIKSQLYQDVFASFIIGNKFDKTFLEFGATDGIEFSNSYMLENRLGWKGVLSEPSPQWHESLRRNRKNTKIITQCIWSKSKETLDFFMSDAGVYSTLNDFVDVDKNSMPENTALRKRNGKVIPVKTITLNDVIDEHFNNITPSYISIDTEGSEYEILKSFNFVNYRPKLFTIEHNYTDLEIKIDDLMSENKYKRVFKNLTDFDAWYVCENTLRELDF